MDNKYQVSAWWTSGKGGITRSEQVPTVIHFTAPVSFGGDPGRWTPEELMLAALASCFTATFQAIATHSKLPFTDLEVIVDGDIQKTASGFQFTHIGIKPRLTIAEEPLRLLAEKVLHKSEALCLVSRAINTPKTFIPDVLVGVPLQHAAF
ncbi:MAG TPA: OsmC family protein [Terriglobales bacterium]|nr:OsmC family protein [Terriglobales bacterium]